MRTTTKAKTTAEKKHATDTGGAPAFAENLSQTEQNVLDLLGRTAVHGHATFDE